MATAPRPGAGARAAVEDLSFTIEVDGVKHVFRPAEVTARQSSEVRSATGRSLRSIMETAEDDPDIDTIAVFVWLARRQAGERKVTFTEVADEMSYSSKIEAGDAADADAEDDSPEA